MFSFEFLQSNSPPTSTLHLNLESIYGKTLSYILYNEKLLVKFLEKNYFDGKIYLFSREGGASVIEASSEFKVLSQNDFDTVFASMPAIAGDSMLIRSDTHLYRIAKGYEVKALPKIASATKRSKKTKGFSKKPQQRNPNNLVDVTAYYLGGKTNSKGIFECSFMIEEPGVRRRVPVARDDPYGLTTHQAKLRPPLRRPTSRRAATSARGPRLPPLNF